MLIKTYTADSKNKVRNASHTYSSAGFHSMKMSDNVISLSAFASLPDARKAEIRNFSMGSNMLSVLDESFSGCTGLLTIAFSKIALHIGKKAFYGCTSLLSFNFPDSILYIGDLAFAGCSDVQKIAFPTKAIDVRESAFAEMAKLQEADIKIKGIPGNAVFKNCTRLQKATIDGQLSEQMFYGCTSLQTVKCNSIASLPKQCFYGCTSLQTVSFKGNNATSIGEECFVGCTSLQELHLIDTSIEYVPKSFISNSNVAFVSFPPTITSLDQVDSNCFAGSSVARVHFSGFTDEYMKANKEKFTSFGAMNTDITFWSASEKAWQLDRSGNGLKSRSVYVISVAIENSANPRLPGMYNDIKRFCDLIEKVYPNDSNVVYKKLGDGGEAEMAATRANLDAAFEEAKQADPELLIFHFSDHGTHDGATGVICLNGYHMPNKELCDKLLQFRNAFAMLCCCYPWSGFTIPNITTNLLVWAAGNKGNKTWMDDYVGHELLTDIYNALNNNPAYNELNLSYNELWKIGPKNHTHYDPSIENFINILPTKYVYGNFDEEALVFTVCDNCHL